ncbi:MAG: TIGR00730 family Rossman fold protein [Candidatus Dependentiae bacterium]
MSNRLRQYLIEYPRFLLTWCIVLLNILIGIWKTIRLPYPRVTFFGGSRLLKSDPYYEIAYNLAYQLVEKKISIITGGGPGIMEAANCGAADAAHKKNEIRSLAIGIRKLSRENIINFCAQDRIIFRSFFARKWLLMQYSSAFLVFPGGYGTLEELAEILNLIETGHFKKVPVVLYGRDYWQPLMDWLTNSALKRKLIEEQELALITLTDNLNEALNILCSCKTIEK